MPERRVGWQPSRFLTDRGEAERAFQLAEQLGSVITRAIKWGDAIFAFSQVRRPRNHTLWPPP
jgi:hypothetical protein